jgi:hypothetical protein
LAAKEDIYSMELFVHLFVSVLVCDDVLRDVLATSNKFPFPAEGLMVHITTPQLAALASSFNQDLEAQTLVHNSTKIIT